MDLHLQFIDLNKLRRNNSMLTIFSPKYIIYLLTSFIVFHMKDVTEKFDNLLFENCNISSNT